MISKIILVPLQFKNKNTLDWNMTKTTTFRRNKRLRKKLAMLTVLTNQTLY